MSRLLPILAVVLGAMMHVGPASSHALEPGYLSIEPVEGELFRVFWRRPDVGGAPMRLDLEMPLNCAPRQSPTPRFDGRAWVSTFGANCAGGLEGGRIAIGRLEATRTDVLVRILGSGGAALTHRLTSGQTVMTVPDKPGQIGILTSYFGLGFEHILEGWDHLLFVFALLLLIRDRWRLVGAVTAFTVAHSITLAAATFGWVSAPSRPVEATIALSIVFLASELVRKPTGQKRLAEQFPWLITFTFGLLHGFGFAGALTEIGLPSGDVPLALLAFNLGVEGGQLAFIVAVLSVWWIGTSITRTKRILSRTGSRTGVAYCIGCIASFWLIERVVQI